MLVGVMTTSWEYIVHREITDVVSMITQCSFCCLSGCKYKVYVYVNLYSAFLRKAPQMRSDMDNIVLPANYTMPAFTPQPQNITVLWLVLILPFHGG